MSFTQDDVNSLATKLAAADLSDGEQAVLDALVDAAGGEVAGFFYDEVEIHFRANVPGSLPDAWQPPQATYLKYELKN